VKLMQLEVGGLNLAVFARASTYAWVTVGWRRKERYLIIFSLAE
jgi:hypothetical protein